MQVAVKMQNNQMWTMELNGWIVKTSMYICAIFKKAWDVPFLLLVMFD